MSKITKVTIEFDDKILTAYREEAEKWGRHNTHVTEFAENHNFNPFQYDPIKWEIIEITGPFKPLEEVSVPKEVQTDDIATQIVDKTTSESTPSSESEDPDTDVNVAPTKKKQKTNR